MKTTMGKPQLVYQGGRPEELHWESTIIKIVVESTENPALLNGGIFPISRRSYPVHRQVFAERIRINIDNIKTSSQSCCNIFTQHFRIASRYAYFIFGIDQTTHKLFPMFNVLYLIQKHIRFLSIDFQMHFQELVQIHRINFGQPFILEIHEKYLIPTNTCIH